MPEMQETSSTSDTIYTDLERKEEKAIGIHDLNSDPATKIMITTVINNTGNFERIQQQQQQESNHTVSSANMNETMTTTAQSAAPTTPPSSINRPTKRSANDFRFGKSIGEGSFSTVYLAKDIHTNKEYASE